MKKKIRYQLLLFLIIIPLFIPMVVAQGLNVTFDNPNVPRIVITPPGVSDSGGGNASFNVSFGDERYWCLNQTLCGNFPLSDWNMGGFGFGAVGNSSWFGNILMRFGAGIQFNNPNNNISSDAGASALFYNAQISHVFRGTVNATDDVIVEGMLNVTGFGTGDILSSEFDALFGEKYGAIQIGSSALFQSNLSVAGLDLNGTIVLLNQISNPSSTWEALFATTSMIPRFIIPVESDDLATYNTRSFMIGGDLNATFTNDLVNCTAQGYDKLSCATDSEGSDLGVENDLQVRGLSFLNGSQITDVCLQNGTNCDGVSGFDPTQDQNITGNWSFQDGLEINVSNGKNVTWIKRTDTDKLCYIWTGSGSFFPQGICTINNLLLEIIAINVKIGVQKLDVGRNDSLSFELAVDTQGDTTQEDTSLFYRGVTGVWEYSRPISWVFNSNPILIPSSVFPANNITFDNFFGNVMTLNNMDLFVDGELNFTDNINGCTGSQVVMGDGRCAENDTIGMPTTITQQNYFSISTNATSDDVGDGVFPFASTNYTINGLSITQNEQNGINYNSTHGWISPNETKIYRITFRWDGDIPDGFGMKMFMFIDNGLIYESEVLNIANVGGRDEFGSGATIIKSVSAFSNLTFELETGQTIAVCPCSARSFFSTVTINEV